MKQRNVLLITGLSGAGKTTILKILEDIKFYTVDNVPPHLIEEFMNMILGSTDIENIAFVSDIRWNAPDELKKAVLKLQKKKNKNIDFRVIFLDSSPETIKIRFKKSRRKHPLQDLQPSLEKAIEKEIELMTPIKEISDIIIDTTNLEPKDFREKVLELIEQKKQKYSTAVKIISFGFKYGVPNDLDYLFDVRFLSNPYYIKELYVLTGKDKEIQEFLEHFPETNETFEKIFDFISKVQEWYSSTGRVSINVGIACTGGKHRSVYIAERLYSALIKKGVKASIEHRDINR
ncbi:hypothetical protein XO10_08955 [Marinitoga sp. 1135]|uniref:Putative P-loop-containing kinase n=1 Tax=Marinitoga piezophila (strain DSM 14283 / JCM 11233 / KA3) TaxID=443254 RepID=H2J5X6_MARPK|nr:MULTISPECIES: RNase adapter RapZ [Marinitoga]AEX86195.1 putative P-loop-containing kinase [Marinitoga piezophila KA3]APT76608.1 hypothetical protein LN42_09635 [Marinitoga sp. 1137]NUU96383.1 hypothetical protein [Marinitoga sp. 1135]NUU98305.1 hypothetical protein [Marinitoga sp. 1138]